MIIFCNGSSQELPAQATVLELIQIIAIEPKGLAVAVNDALVSRTKWDVYILAPNDRVTLIRAAQGG